MDRGTYAAASAGIASLVRLQVVSNNLSNSATPGYKRQILIGSEQPFEKTLASKIAESDPYARGDHDRVNGVINLKTSTDLSVGPVKATGNGLDTALKNENDFFVVNTPQGTQYTKAGNFTINAQGELSTSDGMAVQGSGGPINIPEGGAAVIQENGSVVVDGEEIGRVQIARIDNPLTLAREGNSRFSVKEGPPPPTVEAELLSGSLEMSNVSCCCCKK